jgi:transposase
MQLDSLKLHHVRLGPMPIVEKFVTRLGLRDILNEAIDHPAYVEAIETLMKSILLRPNALYRVGRWASNYDERFVCKTLTDDVIARALDRLFKIDRASLLTKLTLSAVREFGIKTDQIHNDSTSVKFFGAYKDQYPKAIQLKRGHSKDHRPDLKQIVYSLSVTRDGAIPIHFKAYDGNRTDDTTHWEIWQTLRGLLQRSDFLYIADCKLCVTGTMKKIDHAQGFFVTILPRTRQEAEDFAEKLMTAQVRWQHLMSQRASRARKLDHFEVAEGLFLTQEGYRIYWYRSSEKKIRDRENRNDRLARARPMLTQLNNAKRRGPKTEAAIVKAAESVLQRFKVKGLIDIQIELNEIEKFKQTRRGKATGSSLFTRTIRKSYTITFADNPSAISREESMDGVFPLVTNKKLSDIEVLKAYKFQPRLEKRHSLFKSILQIAPVFLKKNQRIESLVFVYFMAQMIASLIERELRQAMVKSEIKSLPLLPEGRPTKAPTVSHVFDCFEDRARHILYGSRTPLKIFSDPMSDEQSQVLNLLNIPSAQF